MTETPYIHLKNELTHHSTVMDVGCIGIGSYCDELIQFQLVGNFAKMYGVDNEFYNLGSLLNRIKTIATYAEIDLSKWELNDPSQFNNWEKLKKLYNVERLDLSTQVIPFTESFDVIVLGHILHFFIPPRRKQILDYCKSHINKDGLIFIRANHETSKTITTEGEEKIIEGYKSYSKHDKIYYLINEQEIHETMHSFVHLEHLRTENDLGFTLVFKK